MPAVLRTFRERQAFIHAVTALLTEELTRDAQTPYAVMLSGGNTPLAAYDVLAQSGVVASPMAGVLFSDERMVPPDSPDSNYGNAAAMIAALTIQDQRLLRVNTQPSVEAAANAYNEDIAAFWGRGGHITLGLLGIGVDGHTASLFTLADVDRGEDRWAIPVIRESGPSRVSVTAALIRRVERLVFLVAGAEKQDIVEIFLRNPERIPAGRIAQALPRVEVWRLF